MSVTRGTVVRVDLDPVEGHEQAGVRPAIIISLPTMQAKQRFPMLAVVPLTKKAVSGPFYPVLQPSETGLQLASTVLVDQVRSIDPKRIRRSFGTLTAAAVARIEEPLKLFLGIETPVSTPAATVQSPTPDGAGGSANSSGP